MAARLEYGFSVLEIAIVIAIVGIIVAVAVPTLNSQVENNRLRGASEALYQTLNQARTESIKRNNDIFVAMQTGATWCFGINENATCDCTVANDCSLGVIRSTDYANTTLTVAGLTGNQAQFTTPRGMAADDGTVNFASNGTTVSVTLNRIGHARVCSSQLIGYDPC